MNTEEDGPMGIRTLALPRMGKKRKPDRDWPALMKKLREKLRLTQVEAAARIRVSQAYWSRLEAGKIDPPDPVIYLIELLMAGKI